MTGEASEFSDLFLGLGKFGQGSLIFEDLGANQKTIPIALKDMVGQPFGAVEKSALHYITQQEIGCRSKPKGQAVEEILFKPLFGPRLRRAGFAHQ